MKKNLDLQAGIKRGKFEYQNSKSETNPKSKCLKLKTKKETKQCPVRTFLSMVILFWSLEFWSFVFVSNFVLRISDFFNFRVTSWQKIIINQ